MTTSTVQPKWTLIGVRVCAACLALWAAAGTAMVFIGVSKELSWLPLLFILTGAILIGYTALRLWQLQPWSRRATIEIFVVSFIVSILGLTNPSIWKSPTIAPILCTVTTVGLIGSIFLTRPAVKALFKNQKSELNNQKLPNA